MSRLWIQETFEIAKLVQGVNLYPVGLAHPERFDEDHLERVEGVLKQGKVKALKAYLGYLPYEPSSPGYLRYYKLAAKYNIPVIFHTGDTYSRIAKLKYAHPLKIGEVAVDYPDTKFVIAHFGNPWIMDTAEVVYKNKNVWTDLSGFFIGNENKFAEWEKSGELGRSIERIRQGVEFTEAPEKFLFGSDWPLVPIRIYRDFVRRLFTEKDHQLVLYKNAKELFKL